MNSYAPVPDSELPKEIMVLDEAIDRHGVLVLRFTAKDERRFEVSFDDYLAYRKGDEGDMLVALSEIRETSSLGHALYEVSGSDYIAWFVQQSRGVRAKDALRHFTLLSIDDVVDVIAFSPPTVSCG